MGSSLRRLWADCALALMPESDPKVLAAIASTDFNGLTGHIAFDDKGDLKGGTITLYDFKDGKKNVLDVVKQ